MSAIWMEQFRKLRESNSGNVHSFSDDRRRILWALWVTRDDAILAYLTPAQISDALRDVEGVHVPRQRVTAILSKEKITVAGKRIAGKPHFKLMKAGEDVLHESISSSIYVDPTRAFSEIRRMEDILSKLKGGLKICDPYIDNKTLDFLSECRTATDARLLTVNVLKESKVRRDFTAFRKEHALQLVIKVISQGILHDRYIIHSDGMLLLGTSLNGFAKKQSFVVNVGMDIRSSTEKAFDDFWSRANNF